MGIVNATSDSFHQGGPGAPAWSIEDLAFADVIDVGGESTRPGAARVEVEEQVRRVVPVLRRLRTEFPETPLSIDTTSASVARAAFDEGASIVNDVSGGKEDPDLLPLVASRGCGVILMHRLRPPDQDEYSDRYVTPPSYGDVVQVVGEALSGMKRRAIESGVEASRILLDPGLGFGKSVEDNVALIRGTSRLPGPVLSALSRKSFVGRLAAPDRETLPGDRLEGTLGTSVAHLVSGARIFRVHDVRAHADALRGAWACIPLAD